MVSQGSNDDQPPPLNSQPHSPNPILSSNPSFPNPSFVSMEETPSNPLCLHHAKNPGAILVSPQLLEAQNYSTWSRSMTMAHTIKNKLGSVDGGIIKPNHSSFFAWIQCNMIVTSWLINSISKDIAASIMYIDSAHHVWNDLHERFAQSNGPRIFHTKKNFATLSQETPSVINYFTKLKMHWDELQSFSPIDACTCRSKCKAINLSQLDRNENFSAIFDGAG